MAKRKNYPGDLRIPGTKDYSLILTNLMSYRNKLCKETDEQAIGTLFVKISEKLKELGFKRPSLLVKAKAGRRKMGRFQDITTQKKESVIDISLKYWELGTEKNLEAKKTERTE